MALDMNKINERLTVLEAMHENALDVALNKMTVKCEEYAKDIGDDIFERLKNIVYVYNNILTDKNICYSLHDEGWSTAGNQTIVPNGYNNSLIIIDTRGEKITFAEAKDYKRREMQFALIKKFYEEGIPNIEKYVNTLLELKFEQMEAEIERIKNI